MQKLVCINSLQSISAWISDRIADRGMNRSRKSKGGGIAVLVSNQWCNQGHATVHHCFCSPDFELLAVSFHPYYLQREFTSVLVVAVHIPPSAGADVACDIISSAVAKLQKQQCSTFLAIITHFNHVSLSLLLSQRFNCFSTAQQGK